MGAERPVPTPVLTGSGSTGLLYQHLRQCHPAGMGNHNRNDVPRGV